MTVGDVLRHASQLHTTRSVTAPPVPRTLTQLTPAMALYARVFIKPSNHREIDRSSWCLRITVQDGASQPGAPEWGCFDRLNKENRARVDACSVQ